MVSVGKARKEWPFIACSNSKFTEVRQDAAESIIPVTVAKKPQREYDRYRKTIVTEGFTLPTKSALITKIDDINKLLNHKFTEAELQTKLKRSGVLQQKQVTIDRHNLLKRRKDAEHRGDALALESIDVELAALEGPKLAFGTSLVKSEPAVSASKTQQERLAELNRANRKFNTENVRRAQLAERKAEAIQRAAVERGEAVANPFARVKVRATTHHDVNALNVPKTKTGARSDDDLFGSDMSRAGTPLSGTMTPTEDKPDGLDMSDFSTARAMGTDLSISEKQLKLEDWRRRARAAVHDSLLGPDPKTRFDHLNFDDEIEPDTWALLDKLNKDMAGREFVV